MWQWFGRREKRMADPAEVELLAAALKRLVGYGATLSSVGRSVSLLELVAADETPTARRSVALSRMRSAVFGLSGEYRIDNWDQDIPAAHVIRALEFLLGLVEPRRRADYRRQRAIDALHAPYSVRTWRLPFGPEHAVMRILAAAILEPIPIVWPYAISEAETTYDVRADGSLRRIRATRLITSNVPELDAITAQTELYSDTDPSVIQIRPLSPGCRLIAVERPHEGRSVVIGHLQIPKIRRNDPPSKIEIEYLSSSHKRTWFGQYRFSNDFPTYIVSVRFDPALPPDAVWFYEHLVAEVFIPNGPTTTTALHPSGDGGSLYIKKFSGIKALLLYGIAWKWDEFENESIESILPK